MRWLRTLLPVTIAAALLGGAAGAAPTPVPAEADAGPAGAGDESGRRPRAARLPVESFTLDNGLRVVVSEDASAPVVAVQLWYHVGAAHGEPGREGLAWLAQQVVLEGARGPDRRTARELVTEAGGTLEAAVGPDHTELRMVLPAHRLELALWTLGRVLGEPVVEAVELARQRRALEAMGRGPLGEGPGARVQALLDSLASGPGPYVRAASPGVPSTGSGAGPAVDTADVRSFLRRYHTPDRAVLVVVGGVRADEVRRRTEEVLGAVPRGHPVEGSSSRAAPGAGSVSTGGGRVDLRDATTPFPQVWVAYALPQGSHPDHDALELLAAVLADDSGRLRTELVESSAVATGILGLRIRRVGPGLLAFGAVVAEGVPPAAVEAALVEQIEGLARRGVGRSEVDGARRRLEAAEVRERLAADGRAGAIQRAALFHGAATPAALALDRRADVGPDEVTAVAARYLAPGRRAVVRLLPPGAAGDTRVRGHP